MPKARAIRLLNAIEAGTLSGSALEILLTTNAGRLTDWEQLLQLRGDAKRLVTSSTAMAAVIASSTAMNAVAASPMAMNAVIASSTAMNAVAASTSAMAAVIASPTAMNAVTASSTAMNAVAASTSAMAAVIASSTAMNAVAGSAVAKLALFASDFALNAIGSSATAMSILFNHISSRSASVNTGGSTSGLTFSTNPPATTKSYLALASMTNDASSGRFIVINPIRSGSTVLNSMGASYNSFANFAAPVPVSGAITVFTTDSNSQTLYVRLINCSDDNIYN